MHETLLAGVDAADADLAHPLGIDGRHLAAELDQFLRSMSAQAGHRHAVEVAAGSQRVGVEVCVRIKPKDAQPLAGFAAVACHRADRTDAQAMVTAEQDGQAVQPQLGKHRIVHRAVPGGHLGQVPVAAGGWQPGVGRADQVAAVEHLEPVPLQHRQDVGHAQRFRAHARAAAGSPDVGRCANQAEVGVRSHSQRGAQMSAANSPVCVGGRSKPYSDSSTAQASSAVST